MKKIIILGILFLISANVQAESLKLVTGEWSPYTSESLQGYGFITEIITGTFQEMGLAPEYEFHKWKRCYSLVIRGDVWAAFPYSFTEERAKEVLFSDTIGKSLTRFFYYKKAKEYKYETLEDLKAYEIGGVKGYFYEDAFQQAGLNVSYTSDELSSLKRLAAGRVELIPLNELVGWDLIKKNFPDQAADFGVLEKPYDTSELRLIVSKAYPGSEELLNRFNTSLKKMKNTDNYRNILKKYGLGQGE